MNKLAIPAILAATVMVAGMFAFMPVEQASTVHTTVIDDLQADIMVLQKISADAAGLDIDDGEVFTVDCNVPFTIVGLIVGEDEGIGGAENFDIDEVRLVGAGAGGTDIRLGSLLSGMLTSGPFLLDDLSIDVFTSLHSVGDSVANNNLVQSIVSDGSPVDFEINSNGNDDEEYDIDAMIIAPASEVCDVT